MRCWRRAWAVAGLVAALGGVTGLGAQDRPIGIVETEPAPARIDGGTYFFVGGRVASMVRNRHTSPVQVTMRAWVFDQGGPAQGHEFLLCPGAAGAWDAARDPRAT